MVDAALYPLQDISGTSTFISHHVRSLATVFGFTIKRLVMGLEKLLLSRVISLKDEGKLEEGSRASWNLLGHFHICPPPCLVVKTPKRHIHCFASAVQISCKFLYLSSVTQHDAVKGGLGNIVSRLGQVVTAGSSTLIFFLGVIYQLLGEV